MVRLNLENEFFSDIRLRLLSRYLEHHPDMIKTQWAAIGLLATLWHYTQGKELVFVTKEEFGNYIEETEDKIITSILRELVKIKYLSKTNDGRYKIHGNVRHIEFLKQAKISGKKGGQKTRQTWQYRNEKIKSLIKNQEEGTLHRTLQGTLEQTLVSCKADSYELGFEKNESQSESTTQVFGDPILKHYDLKQSETESQTQKNSDPVLSTYSSSEVLQQNESIEFLANHQEGRTLHPIKNKKKKNLNTSYLSSSKSSAAAEKDFSSQSSSEKTGIKNTDPIPYEQIVEIWNSNVKGNLSPIKKLTDARRRKISARWKEEPSIEYWSAIIARFCGIGWIQNSKLSFDWLIDNDTRHVKTAEGGWDDYKTQPKPQEQKRSWDHETYKSPTKMTFRRVTKNQEGNNETKHPDEQVPHLRS